MKEEEKNSDIRALHKQYVHKNRIYSDETDNNCICTG